MTMANMTRCPRGCENSTLIFMAANSWPPGLHSLSRRETLPCIGNFPALVRSRMFEEDLLLPRYYYTNTRLNCTPKLYPSAPPEKRSSQPSSKKLFFATDGGQFRKPHWSKVQRRPVHGVLSPSGYIYNTALATKAQGTFQKRDRKF